MQMIDILRPNPNICLEDTTNVVVICPECGDREWIEIENSCLSEIEIITGEMANPGPCPDCQNTGYHSQNLNCFM